MAGAGWHDFVPGEVLTAANVQDYLQDQTVMKFASAAARAAALPSPSQGMMSFLNDTGVVETYYAAWNATTNPGGKTAGAGWYATDRNDGLVNIVPPTVNFSGGSATANSLGLISFSGVSSLSLNNVFSSIYKNYRININLVNNSSGTTVLMRLRKNGVDYSAANYLFGGMFVRSTGVTGAWSGNLITSWHLSDYNGGGSGAGAGSGYVDLHNPYSDIYQSGWSALTGNDSSTLKYTWAGLSCFSGQDANDGFTLYQLAAGSTFTGSIQVFGYNQ